jgi:hypothetical protein
MRPDTGRFWSADSYEGDTFDPRSLHKYTYVNADPANRIDPSGREGEYSIGGLLMVAAVLGTIASIATLQYTTPLTRLKSILR